MATEKNVYDYLVKSVGGGDAATAKKRIDALSQEARNELISRIESTTGKSFIVDTARPIQTQSSVQPESAPASNLKSADAKPAAPAPVAMSPVAQDENAKRLEKAKILESRAMGPERPIQTQAVVPDNRGAEIDGNLREGLQSSPDLFKTRDSFYKAYDYYNKPESERRQLDAFYDKNKPQPTNISATPRGSVAREGIEGKPTGNLSVGEATKLLISGGSLDKAFADTKEGRLAANNAKTVKSILGMSDDELASSFRNGTLKSDFDISKFEAYSPEAAAKLRAARESASRQNAIDITNSGGRAFVNAVTGVRDEQEDPVSAMLAGLAKSLMDTSGATPTEEEKSAKTKLAEDAQKIKELQLERDKIYEDLVKAHPGMPKSILMAEASQKAKPLNDQLNTMLLAHQTDTAKYQAMVEERKAGMDAKQQLAERQLKVYQLYTDNQDRLAKSAASKNANSTLDTVPVNGVMSKVLIDKNTGEIIKNFGPDIEKNKDRFQLTDYMGMKMAFDPITKTLTPVDTAIKGNPEQEQKLQKEYAADPMVRGFATVKDAYTKVAKIATDTANGKGNGIKDLAVMYSFIKGLDPTSVVRESEVALMNQANSLWNRIITSMKNVAEGRVLSNQVVGQVAEQMREFYGIAQSELAQKQAGYIRRASDVMARPNRVIDGDIYATMGTGNARDYAESNSQISDFFINAIQ